MNDFISGLVERIKSNPTEIAYSAIIFVGTAAFILFLIRIGLMLRRWFLHSKIRKEGPDFETEAKYIRDNKKTLNQVQRFLLSQTGKVFGVKSLLWMLFYIFAVIVVIMLLDPLSSSELFIWISYILSVIFELFSIPFFVISVNNLVKHGRIIPFIIWLWIIVVYGFNIYYFFIDVLI